MKRCRSILMLAVLLSGCSVAAAVKDASTRARESAAMLKQGWQTVEPFLRDDVAAIASFRATMRERIDSHEELLQELEGLSSK